MAQATVNAPKSNGTPAPAAVEHVDPRTLKDQDAVLKALSAGQITKEEAGTRLNQLRPKATTGLHCKVSAKGALSLYGLSRWPVTLYIEQWQRLLEFAPQVKAFLEEHDGELKRKDDPARESDEQAEE